MLNTSPGHESFQNPVDFWQYGKILLWKFNISKVKLLSQKPRLFLLSFRLSLFLCIPLFMNMHLVIIGCATSQSFQNVTSAICPSLTMKTYKINGITSLRGLSRRGEGDGGNAPPHPNGKCIGKSNEMASVPPSEI